MTAATSSQRTARKLVVEVADARDLLPKDGQGSASAYVVADFDGQRRRTSTKFRDLNPAWNEALDFLVSDPENMEFEELEIEVLNDKRFCNATGSARKNHFLGRVKLYGTQFSRRGSEGLVYFPLEKKSVFTWIRGEIGLRIYYYDEDIADDAADPPPEDVPPEKPSVTVVEVPPAMETHVVAPELVHGPPPPPMVVTEEQAPPMSYSGGPPEMAEMRKMEARRSVAGDRVRVLRRANSTGGGEYSPKAIPGGKFRADSASAVASTTERSRPLGLVEPMQYLFIKIVKARGISPSESPYVQIRTAAHFKKSKPAVMAAAIAPDSPEWQQVFALAHNNSAATLEISVWDSPQEQFLGGVCFDLSDVPVRDPPDSPLAPQWYRLEGGDGDHASGRVSGDIQLSVWIGTQADDSFPEAWSSDAPFVSHTRSKVYQSPKLWYLRATMIEAQDLQIAANLPPLTAPEIRVKAQLGFQSARTRRATMSGSSFHWNEDLLFVAGEPLEESLIVLVEDRTCPDPILLGHVVVPVSGAEQRLDDRCVASKWFPLENGGAYCGRIQMRVCLEGGYHVVDEAAQVCSDFRATAKQLWKAPVGILEVGILGARGLVAMKSGGEGKKGWTDAYCVAKYGKKWVRTRTVTESLEPRWNEQYTWQVYEACTVLTVGVFDNALGEGEGESPMGKVRVRVSALEPNRVYTHAYPLLVLTRCGLKKMGQVEIALRFACAALLPEAAGGYAQPLLPRMHYLRPLGVAQQEALRCASTRLVAAWLGRSEPPLAGEVVRYMLDADSHAWSLRRSKANWFRILALLGWAVGLARWLDGIRRWRAPARTVLVHALFLVLVWYPEVAVPTGSLYVGLVGAWHYRFRPRIPGGMDARLSQAQGVDADELDEEFDTLPTSKPPEVVRARYDRLRVLAARVQTLLGDLAAQGERLQALLTWRDPTATKLFIGLCFAIAVLLYSVPPKMVAVALGFYYLRHPMFRDPMPPPTLNFFRRLPTLSDRLI